MCDTIVIVEADRVLFAKNSDRDPNEAQVLEWQPRAEHLAGSRLRCTYLEIPQVRQTWGTLISRPFWMWGAEMGTNEHGVTIGNEAVFTRQPYAATGLTGMDLLRLALERAATAAEAVEVIVTLLAAHGQGGGCGLENRGFTYHNSFLIADPSTAFVLETAGRQHAVEQLTRGARSISNVLSIAGFAERHADRLRGAVARGPVRQCRTQQQAGDVRRPADLARLLRDHHPPVGTTDGGPRYDWIRGGMTPCMHAGGLIAASQTVASWISELRSTGARHWATATAAPCLSLFKPIALDEPLELGAPTDRADDRSLWWRHERLHRRAARDPASMPAAWLAERERLEAAWFAESPAGAAALAEHNRWLAAGMQHLIGGKQRDRRPWYVRRYWRVRNRTAGLTI